MPRKLIQLGLSLLSDGEFLTNGPDDYEGGPSNNIIFGLFGDDTIRAQSGNDIIFGGPGDDYLAAGQGFDKIFGGFGNDTLRGGTDRNEMTGGPGSDVFQATRLDTNIIKDWENRDLIDLESGFADYYTVGENSNGDVIIRYFNLLSEGLFRLEGVGLDEFDQSRILADLDDYPAGVFTPASIVPDGPRAQGEIEFEGDVDFLAFDVVAGTEYRIRMLGDGVGSNTLLDPYLRLGDGEYALLAEDDDGALGSSARINYTPTEDDTLYIVATSADPTGLGSYTLDVDIIV